MKNITNYELLNALVNSTSTMNNWITNCRTCEECEKCALFPCIAIKQTDKNKVIIDSWIMNCRKCEECKGCALFPCASVKQTNNKIDMKQSIVEAAYDYATEKTKFRKDVLKEVDADTYVSRHADSMEDFQCGAEWQAKQMA